MSLKIELKPGERVIIGNCVVRNDDQRTRLFIEGDTPVLREKDILTAAAANSPAKRVYLAVQLMYLDGLGEENANNFKTLSDQILDAAPSAAAHVEAIGKAVLTGNLYKALKEAKKLIAYEEELIGHATGCGPGICEDGATNRTSERT